MKVKVFILLVESVYDYEQTTNLFVYDILDKAQAEMLYDVKCFEKDAPSGWECVRNDKMCVCYQEPDDYTRNHISWEIWEREVELCDMYIVTKDFVNCYIEDTQQWASNGEAAVFTKEQAYALVKSERDRFNLHGLRGACAFKLTDIQSQLVQEDFPHDDTSDD